MPSRFTHADRANLHGEQFSLSFAVLGNAESPKGSQAVTERNYPLPEQWSAATEAFRKLGDAFRKAGRVMCDAWWNMAAKEYLRHHDRLPGGESNARLRKKRRTVVLNWFANHLHGLQR